MYKIVVDYSPSEKENAIVKEGLIKWKKMGSIFSKILSFFNTKLVSQKIVENKLSETQLFLYFYLTIIYDAIASTSAWFSINGKTASLAQAMDVWSDLFIAIFGLIILFIVNGAHKGRNFLAKYFAFSITVGVKYAVLLCILLSLPTFFYALNTDIYHILVTIVVDILMVSNIALRIYQTR